MPAHRKKSSTSNAALSTISRSSLEFQLEERLSQVRELESNVGALIQEMQERVFQLEGLARVSALLNSTLDPAVVREKALEATCELLRCETASLYLVDPNRAELFWDSALGEEGNRLKGSVRLPINDRSIAGYVAMTGEPEIVNDVQADRRHFKKRADASKPPSGGFVARTMICVPLQARGKTIGVLQAINKIPSVPKRPKGEFYGDDLAILQALANPVGIAVENAQLFQRLKSSFYDTCEALAESIERKDRYTGGHTKRVVYYSMTIAKYLPLSAEELENLRLGAILHDVGKIGIEDKILKKEAPLDVYEWPVMKEHPEIGHQILKRVEGLKPVMGAIRLHHERFDGKGYPLGLRGEEIPLMARIVSVADTYDAMVSTRPYRKGLDPKIAYDEILKYSGAQFCPTVVEAFKQAFERDFRKRKEG